MTREHKRSYHINHRFKMIYQSVVFAAILASANAFSPAPRAPALSGKDYMSSFHFVYSLCPWVASWSWSTNEFWCVIGTSDVHIYSSPRSDHLTLACSPVWNFTFQSFIIIIIIFLDLSVHTGLKMATTDTLYTFEKSQKLMAEAKTLMPGGVSSPVRYLLWMLSPYKFFDMI